MNKTTFTLSNSVDARPLIPSEAQQRSISSAQQAITEGQARFDRACFNLSAEQLWPIYIDFQKHRNGPDCFDVKEPGYREAMVRGMNLVRDSIGLHFNADFYVEIHDVCVDGVVLGQPDNLPSVEGNKKGFRGDGESGGCRVALGPSCKTSGPYKFNQTEAFLELQADKILSFGASEDKEFLSMFLPIDQNHHTNASGHTEEQIKQNINRLIEKYEEQIRFSSNPDQKLEAIADLCRALEIYHVFVDGNGRTILFALLTKLLIENGFRPALLRHVNFFDGGFKREEIVNALKDGIDRFESIMSVYPNINETSTTEEILEELVQFGMPYLKYGYKEHDLQDLALNLFHHLSVVSDICLSPENEPRRFEILAEIKKHSK